MSVKDATGTKTHPVAVAGQFATLSSDVFASLIASNISVALACPSRRSSSRRR